MRNMTEGSIPNHLLSYAVPVVLGNLFQLTYNAVDSIIIGKFAGEEALAAVSASNPVMNIAILGVSGISIGASILMSRFFGAGDHKMLKKEIGTTITIGAIASLFVFLLGQLGAEALLRLLRTPQGILPLAAPYLRVILFGFLFTFQYNVLAAAMRSVGDSKTPVTYLALSSVLNACLDILLVGVCGAGVFGAGIATVIAEGVSVLLCLFRIRRDIPLLRLSRADFTPDSGLMRETLSAGMATALQQACLPLGKVFIQGMINAQGVSMIAAFNAVSRIDDFAVVPEMSLAGGIMTCIAQNRGAGKNERIRETIRAGLRLELLYGCVICVLTLAGRGAMMSLFAAQDSREMIRMGSEYLLYMSFIYFLPAVNNTLQGAFRGMGDLKTPLIGTTMQMTIRVLMMGLLIPRVGLPGAAFACAGGWLMMMFYGCRKYQKTARVFLKGE